METDVGRKVSYFAYCFYKEGEDFSGTNQGANRESENPETPENRTYEEDTISIAARILLSILINYQWNKVSDRAHSHAGIKIWFYRIIWM